MLHVKDSCVLAVLIHTNEQLLEGGKMKQDGIHAQIIKEIKHVKKMNERGGRTPDGEFASVLIMTDGDTEEVEETVKAIVTELNGHLFTVSSDYSELRHLKRITAEEPGKPHVISTALYIAPDAKVLPELDLPETIILFKDLINLTPDKLRWTILSFLRTHRIYDEKAENQIRILENLKLAVVVISEPIDSFALFQMRSMDGKDSFLTVDLRNHS